ncbi:MAG: FIG00457576: hypothetical protein [uncultured Caballeronia sp.]|nr:MAG: FIG00457576: hypothetical protein [uncultured Caballeronia sp.]
MKKRAIAGFAMIGLFAAITTVHGQDKAIQPQQTFSFMPNSFGCLSKDKFDSIDQHAQAGVQEFFSGFQCMPTPESAHFRVVQVVGHDVEFVNASNSDTQGLWTSGRFIKQ